jgi:hypothetical protein
MKRLTISIPSIRSVIAHQPLMPSVSGHLRRDKHLRKHFSTASAPSLPKTTPKPKYDPQEESFISKHIGKIALGTLGFVVGLIYRYYVSIQDRNEVEKQLVNSQSIEPYEIQYLRHVNGWKIEQYLQLLQLFEIQLQQHQELSYEEFIQIYQQHFSSLSSEYEIQGGYLLDRILLSYIEKYYIPKQVSNHENQINPKLILSTFEKIHLPIELYLILCNLCFQNKTVLLRIQSLFYVGRLLDGHPLANSIIHRSSITDTTSSSETASMTITTTTTTTPTTTITNTTTKAEDEITISDGKFC